jgi:YebC/PmpR family DNA-binding regulatory protein
MSGHSKWSTIKRQKGANDAKRGQAFTKIANVIALAARLGNSGDINANPRLRLAVETARGVNMPKDNIQRAIDKGLGNLPGQIVEEVLYEGYGPGKVAFLVEGVTDNKNRTNSEVRNLFERSGGNLGSSGSVAYMFDKKGEIKVQSKGGNLEDEMLELIDLGAEDVEEFNEEGISKFLIYTVPTGLIDVSTKITQSGYTVDGSELIFKPNLTTEVSDPETVRKVLDLAEKLEDHDDVQRVYANFDIPESVMIE